ncbi:MULTISPECIES: cytochrome c oxidase assembly protein [unclassified Streptomyces]|uniref:cytochrome c oxidase assembly protein n=1 Tax=unclassified Streptomyces TaxID=2593676 RepID=UPI00380F430B
MRMPALPLSETGAGSLPELTWGRCLFAWQLDVPALVLVITLGVLYGWAVLRLKHRGEHWPIIRTAAFALLGLGTLTVATMSALAVYDRVLFWPAAVQNVLLDLIAPLGLALGDPLQLAVRALPERGAGRVRRAMAGRLLRLLTFPLVSTVLVLTTELTVYFTPYFETALGHRWLHEVMYLHLLLAGSLFVVPVLTREEALPAWCTHPVRAALVFLDGIIDAVPGIAVMTHSALIAGAWYRHHAPSWAPDVHQDQQLGGGAMLSIAELVAVPFLLVILMQWFRAERAQSAALDRRLKRELAPAAPVPGQAPDPDLLRPWWETEDSEVAERIRQQRPRK